MSKGSLGDRMKTYEKVSAIKLMRRTPVIIRLDGKAFHTYTRDMDKPFDKDLSEVRYQTVKMLVDNVQGCVLGYSQSDEISLLLKDWDTFQSQAWFDNKLQKIVSVVASMCTAYWQQNCNLLDGERTSGSDKFAGKTALFDARAFNVPKEDVVNYFLWRQIDWERNSIQMLAQSVYSHKQLQGVSCKELVTKLEDEKGIIWGNLHPVQKLGETYVKGSDETYLRFNQQRNLVDKLLEGNE